MASTSDAPPTNYNDSACSQEVIQLDVSGRKFKTTKGTLCDGLGSSDGSGFFKTFFSGNWSVRTQEDGSIFVDADPDVFDILLRYLRTGVFPLDFNPARGHNYTIYSRLEQAADYYEMPLLYSWLTNKLYQNCVVYKTYMRPVVMPRKAAGCYTDSLEEVWSSARPGITHEIISCRTDLIKIETRPPRLRDTDIKETYLYGECKEVVEFDRSWSTDTS